MEPRPLKADVRGQGEPVVLVPGGLSGWLSWVPHQERLAANYRAIRVQPIHNELGSQGKSGDPSYNAETEREALRLTLDELGIASAHFAGWSGGGRALIEFALVYTDRVRSLTLIEPAARWILERLGEGDRLVDEVGDFIRGLEGRDVTEEDLAQFVRFAGFVGPGDDPRAHPNWERWRPLRMSLSWQALLESSGRSVDELAHITVPTLVFKGTNTSDWLKRVVDVISERMPNARSVVLEGDHACHIQQIDEYMDVFEKHLASIGREASDSR